MMRSLLLSLAFLAPAAPLWAQAAVVPKTALTAQQQAALTAIRDLRDSVLVTSSLLASLQRDLAQKPGPSLEALAGHITIQCEASERQRVSSRKLLASQAFTDKVMLQGQKNMLASMDQLQKPLATCGAVWSPLAQSGKGEEVRGYGISRSKPIVAGLNAFERSVVDVSKDLQLPVREVLRAGPSPADVPPRQLQPPPPPRSP